MDSNEGELDLAAELDLIGTDLNLNLSEGSDDTEGGRGKSPPPPHEEETDDRYLIRHQTCRIYANRPSSQRCFYR